jgi:transcriptional regulator with XRE-family HTH domain
MGTRDNQVGSNVKRIREALGMSQAEVAEEMTQEGCPGFYPQTILKVEKGTRSLKLTEADTLARVLKVQVSELVDPEGPRSRQLLDVIGTRHRVYQLRDAHARALDATAKAKVEADSLATQFAEAKQEARRAKAVFEKANPGAKLPEDGLVDGEH